MKIIATIKWPYWSTLDSWLSNFNFNERSSSARESLPLKVVFHWNLFHCITFSFFFLNLILFIIPSLWLFVAYVSQEIKSATWVDTSSHFFSCSLTLVEVRHTFFCVNYFYFLLFFFFILFLILYFLISSFYFFLFFLPYCTWFKLFFIWSYVILY